jgi:cyclophilin family peptidyl-prolyl cis-trans isomerase
VTAGALGPNMKKKLCLKRPRAPVLWQLAVAITAFACMSTPHAFAQAAETATPVAAAATGQAIKKALTTAEVLAESTPADWRSIDPQSTLYMDLPAGRVIIELAPQFAPHYVANVETLARQGYFNGLWVERVQDNYVAQWGDPEGKKSVGNAQRNVAAEFERTSRGLSFMPLAEPDTYAPEVGFSDGFPVALDPKLGRAWLIHCYGMVGAGRDNDVDSGGGTELYAVIGHAPRHLDRNVTLLGRVVQGIELLSSLPRGTGAMGFYEKPEQRVTIKSFKVASDVPEAQRAPLEELRTDTQTFTDYIDARRNRHEEWFKVPAGHIDVCNVPIPVRARVVAAPAH